MVISIVFLFNSVAAAFVFTVRQDTIHSISVLSPVRVTWLSHTHHR